MDGGVCVSPGDISRRGEIDIDSSFLSNELDMYVLPDPVSLILPKYEIFTWRLHLTHKRGHMSHILTRRQLLLAFYEAQSHQKSNITSNVRRNKEGGIQNKHNKCMCGKKKNGNIVENLEKVVSGCVECVYPKLPLTLEATRRSITLYFPYFIENTTEFPIGVSGLLIPPLCRLYTSSEIGTTTQRVCALGYNENTFTVMRSTPIDIKLSQHTNTVKLTLEAPDTNNTLAIKIKTCMWQLPIPNIFKPPVYVNKWGYSPRTNLHDNYTTIFLAVSTRYAGSLFEKSNIISFTHKHIILSKLAYPIVLYSPMQHTHMHSTSKNTHQNNTQQNKDSQIYDYNQQTATPLYYTQQQTNASPYITTPNILSNNINILSQNDDEQYVDSPEYKHPMPSTLSGWQLIPPNIPTPLMINPGTDTAASPVAVAIVGYDVRTPPFVLELENVSTRGSECAKLSSFQLQLLKTPATVSNLIKKNPINANSPTLFTPAGIIQIDLIGGCFKPPTTSLSQLLHSIINYNNNLKTSDLLNTHTHTHTQGTDIANVAESYNGYFVLISEPAVPRFLLRNFTNYPLIYTPKTLRESVREFSPYCGGGVNIFNTIFNDNNDDSYNRINSYTHTHTHTNSMIITCVAQTCTHTHTHTYILVYIYIYI
eukprot:GHVR01166878.1.p1 GENE.GHVR01166878.1~~GHVR01166878.1.p1  ORF type:complete len:650 (+),score=191.60 GHVR01166878.1:1270-3219(+)